jgi:hypothetical protein
MAVNGGESSRANIHTMLALPEEATAGFEPAMGVLQTPALPLGYVADAAAQPPTAALTILLSSLILSSQRARTQGETPA